MKAPIVQLVNPNAGRTAVSKEDFARELRDVADWIEQGKYGDVRNFDFVLGTEQGDLHVRTITPPGASGEMQAVWGRMFAALVRDITT